ncbi:hypothetical protein GCM10010151_68810 [Actinoallomurus spadix]|uniref:Uncharacterized protein n=1 Tax=Actinoallomurus spadix TaxID=79912 RepID=A0ABN0XPC2_9ACTN
MGAPSCEGGGLGGIGRPGDAVPEVAGSADTWWRGGDSLVALYTGEAEHFAVPRYRTALIYSGLDDWGLRG